MSHLSFNSFENIEKNTRPISDILSDHTRYKAHRPPKDGVGEKELLEEHIILVNRYALRLVSAHHIESLINDIIEELVCDFKNALSVGNWVKKLFLSAIIYHDYGKINPNFQSVKMKEDSFVYDKTIAIDTQHSKLSAYIFVNDFVQAIQQEEYLLSDERYFLFLMNSLFSIPILRHHASTLEYYISFKEEELQSIKHFLEIFAIDKSFDDFFIRDRAENLLKDEMEQHGSKAHLMIGLMKLNFSLLTASDFYATNEYMAQFPVHDYGLIDSKFKKHLYDSFWNFSYNQDTKENWAHIKSLDFEQLKKQSGKNLNTLRAKLLIDAVETIRQNPDKKLYYLEAPTGAGKTNLSLALALELLQRSDELNKVLYVFPFTTLITQTFAAIKKTLSLSNEHIIQLHSKSGFHSLNEGDGKYGDEKLNYLDNLFLNFPITLLSHIKFFNVLKGYDKENNYIFHRLANSVVIIDELQSYNPRHWDKMAWMLSEYSRMFNIKFILMSATLPKINEADKSIEVPFERLIQDKNKYFQNPNFGERITFDFSLLDVEWKDSSDREQYLRHLADFAHEKSEVYAQSQNNKVRTIIEFIKKKSANDFYQKAMQVFGGYKIYLLSGEILDPRRQQIIKAIKDEKDAKVLLVTTQVVEAGVDIDMDLGFKDRSLIDSDEQLAGRVNRNATKKNCKVYIFNLDNEIQIYKTDDRRQVTKEKISRTDYEEILRSKDFDKLYQLVFDKINKKNKNVYNSDGISNYKSNFRCMDFKKINQDFRLIEDDTTSVFVPLSIPISDLEEMLEVAELFGISTNEFIDGKQVFQKYIDIISNKDSEYHRRAIDTKKLYGLMSKFMFSVYKNAADDLKNFADQEYSERFGLIYLLNWKDYRGIQVYSYESGIDQYWLKNDNFL